MRGLMEYLVIKILEDIIIFDFILIRKLILFYRNPHGMGNLFQRPRDYHSTGNTISCAKLSIKPITKQVKIKVGNNFYLVVSLIG